MTQNRKKINTQVCIVGGGPVGLYLAISLLRKGVECRVIEKRKKPVPDSRSLGIHPVSLELFDDLSISEKFLEKGLKIKEGLAYADRIELGAISFHKCPKPHNYILACPQSHTETILREYLLQLNNDCLITEAEFLRSVYVDDHDYRDIYYQKDGNEHFLRAKYLVGCDGKNSRVRKDSSIHFSGKRYPDTYVMGDFNDHTPFGKKAVVFLPKDGLIECFPLPDGKRRWVVKSESYQPEPSVDFISASVRNRTPFEIKDTEATMLSSFGVQHYLAEFLFKDRVLLAGDAAHVVSPIGGQGMNLGWLGAEKLAKALKSVLIEKTDISALKNYEVEQRKIARKVARRAEINMILGRKKAIPYLRNALLKIVLHSPLRHKIARLFTMRGLEKGWL